MRRIIKVLKQNILVKSVGSHSKKETYRQGTMIEQIHYFRNSVKL